MLPALVVTVPFVGRLTLHAIACAARARAQAHEAAAAPPAEHGERREEADADPERVSLYDDLGPLLVQLRSPQANAIATLATTTPTLAATT